MRLPSSCSTRYPLSIAGWQVGKARGTCVYSSCAHGGGAVIIVTELVELARAFVALIVDMGPSVLAAVAVGGLIESAAKRRRFLVPALARRRWLAHPIALAMAFASPL